MITRANGATSSKRPLPSYDKALRAYERDRADILGRDMHDGFQPGPREGQVSSKARILKSTADGKLEKLELVEQSRNPSFPTNRRTYDVDLEKGEITVLTSTEYQHRIVPGGIMSGGEGSTQHYVIDTKNQTIAAFDGT